VGADSWSGWTGKVDTSAASDRAAMTPDDAVAVALLARSAKAASAVAYAGHAVTSDSAGTTTTMITHLPGRGTLSRALDTPSAAARFAPEGRSGSFADDGRPLALLRDNYRVLREADLDAVVAGRPAAAVVAVDADGTLDARYWLDEATGLLLRKELFDVSGQVRSRTGFDTLTLGIPADLVVPSGTQDAWTEPLGSAALATARTQGCACPESLPGGLELLDARRAPAGAVATMPVVHQLFSDGVATVSLFSIAASLSSADTDGLVARGFRRLQLGDHYAWVRGGSASVPTVTVVWACKDSVLTLVTDDAEDPLSTAGRVLAAFPPVPDPGDGSIWSRIARGWHRLTGGST
jgi:sigma-E factor negative regulatory protein RseB